MCAVSCRLTPPCHWPSIREASFVVICYTVPCITRPLPSQIGRLLLQQVFSRGTFLWSINWEKKTGHRAPSGRQGTANIKHRQCHQLCQGKKKGNLQDKWPVEALLVRTVGEPGQHNFAQVFFLFFFLRNKHIVCGKIHLGSKYVSSIWPHRIH